MKHSVSNFIISLLLICIPIKYEHATIGTKLNLRVEIDLRWVKKKLHRHTENIFIRDGLGSRRTEQISKQITLKKTQHVLRLGRLKIVHNLELPYNLF